MTDATSPTLDQIRCHVQAILRERFGPAADNLGDEDELSAVLGDSFDSLAALEIIVQVETEFAIEVDFVQHDVRYWFASLSRISQFVHDQLADLAALGSRS